MKQNLHRPYPTWLAVLPVCTVAMEHSYSSMKQIKDLASNRMLNYLIYNRVLPQGAHFTVPFLYNIDHCGCGTASIIEQP